jgi:hypothetical protein
MASGASAVIAFFAHSTVRTLEAQCGSPAGPVPVERLAARRAALLDQIGTGVAVVRSAALRSLDRDYPQDSDYREDNDFFYLTGLEAPGAWLVLIGRKDASDSAMLYLPERELDPSSGSAPPWAPAARRAASPESRTSAPLPRRNRRSSRRC